MYYLFEILPPVNLLSSGMADAVTDDVSDYVSVVRRDFVPEQRDCRFARLMLLLCQTFRAVPCQISDYTYLKGLTDGI
jgi:hypothetical protein